MNGNQIRDRIRNILRDKQTQIQKGEYWSDSDILLFVNESLLRVTDYLVKNKKRGALSRLVRSQVYNVASERPGGLDRSLLLPSDYFHWISSDIKPDGESRFRTARTYIGGKAVPYLDVRHYAVIIYGNMVFYSAPVFNFAGDIRLHYYKVPDAIAFDNAVLNEYTDDIYYMIVNVAVEMLGRKEVYQQRDIMKIKRFATAAQFIPPEHQYFVPIKKDKDEWQWYNAPAEDVGR